MWLVPSESTGGVCRPNGSDRRSCQPVPSNRGQRCRGNYLARQHPLARRTWSSPRLCGSPWSSSWREYWEWSLSAWTSAPRSRPATSPKRSVPSPIVGWDWHRRENVSEGESHPNPHRSDSRTPCPIRSLIVRECCIFLWATHGMRRRNCRNNTRWCGNRIRCPRATWRGRDDSCNALRVARRYAWRICDNRNCAGNSGGVSRARVWHHPQWQEAFRDAWSPSMLAGMQWVWRGWPRLHAHGASPSVDRARRNRRCQA